MNLPLVFIYKFRKKEIQIQPPGEPREHRLGEVLQGRWKSKCNIILSFFSLNLSFIFKWHFDKFQIQPPGEPLEHHLCEVQQGRSKSKFNITLSYSIVLFFWFRFPLSKLFRNKKDLI